MLYDEKIEKLVEYWANNCDFCGGSNVSLLYDEKI